MEIKIYLTNLAQYNAGSLVGKWLELPMDEEELEKELGQILGTDEEYFITDYEAPFSIDEYENLENLNSFAEEFSALDEHEQHKVIYLINNASLERDEALQHYEDVTFYEDMTLKDVACELVDEGLFGDIPEKIKFYIDYERLANDLSIDGYCETNKGTFCYSS